MYGSLLINTYTTYILLFALNIHSPCSIKFYDFIHKFINFWAQLSDVVHNLQYLRDLASDAIMEGSLSPEQHKHDDTTGVCVNTCTLYG